MSEPITNLADAVAALGALPMPVGPDPQMDADLAKAPWGRGEDGRPILPMGAHWTDVPELVDQYLAGIQARVDGAQSGNWYVASTVETWRAPGTVCTRVDGYNRTVGQFTNVSDADLQLVLYAHSDLTWCLEMIAELRTRVAELEAERHTTNEALDDAVQALRANQDEPAKGLSVDRSADRLTALFAPTQALREDEPEAPALTVYRASHDVIVMGLYTTAAEARKHCETALRSEHAESTKVELWWREDEDTVDQPEDGEAELFAHVTPRAFDRGRTWNTGYVVTPIEVATAFDEEADE